MKPQKDPHYEGFEEGRGYTREDWDAVSDNPEWTAEDFAMARPFAEVFPDLAESIRRDKEKYGSRMMMAVPIDLEIVERFQAEGPDWQDRIIEVLRAAKPD